MLWAFSVIVKTSRRFISSSVLVWCVKDRPGHLGQLAPLLLLPHYPQYQSIQLLSKYFLPVSHKYFLSVNISLCDGWRVSVAGPGVSSACVPALAPVEMCRKLCGWGETECELYRGYEPCTLSTLYNTLHTQYAPNLGLDGEMMGQMCQCVSVLFLWTLELWTSHT